MEDVNNWIGRSMYAGDSNSHLVAQRAAHLPPRHHPGGNRRQLHRRSGSRRRSARTARARSDSRPAAGPSTPPPAARPPAPPSSTPRTGEIATVRGNGATLNGTALVLPGTATNGNQTAANISAYLDLPNGIVSSRPEPHLRSLGHSAFLEKLAAHLRFRKLPRSPAAPARLPGKSSTATPHPAASLRMTTCSSPSTTAAPSAPTGSQRKLDGGGGNRL